AQITKAHILRELARDPLKLGYNTTIWTVPLLASHLSQRYDAQITPRTLRCRMKEVGLRWKRPRYVYDVLLFEDETIIRLFPPLRACWALCGAQAAVPITGRNAKRTLFGVLNPRTGHRILMHAERCRQSDFQAYLCLIRHCYPGRRIWLLLDEAPCHMAIL